MGRKASRIHGFWNAEKWQLLHKAKWFHLLFLK
jgi:hypothetical protein